MIRSKLASSAGALASIFLLLSGGAARADSNFTCEQAAICKKEDIKEFQNVFSTWDRLKAGIAGYYFVFPDLRILPAGSGYEKIITICPPPGMTVYLSDDAARYLEGAGEWGRAFTLAHELAHAREHFGAAEGLPRAFDNSGAYSVNSDTVAAAELQADARALFWVLISGYRPVDDGETGRRLVELARFFGADSSLTKERVESTGKMISKLERAAAMFRMAVRLALLRDFQAAQKVLDMVSEQTWIEIGGSTSRLEIPEVLFWKALVTVEMSRDCAVWAMGDSKEARDTLQRLGTPFCGFIVSDDFVLGGARAEGRAGVSCEGVTRKTFLDAAFLIEKAGSLGLDRAVGGDGYACANFYAGNPATARERLVSSIATDGLGKAVRTMMEENLSLAVLAEMVSSKGRPPRLSKTDRARFKKLSPYNKSILSVLLGQKAGVEEAHGEDLYSPPAGSCRLSARFEGKLFAGLQDFSPQGECPAGWRDPLSGAFKKGPGSNGYSFIACEKETSEAARMAAMVVPAGQTTGAPGMERLLVTHAISGPQKLGFDSWLCAKDGPRQVRPAGVTPGGEKVYSAFFRGEQVLIFVKDGFVTELTVVVR